jgi:hypothetical protein
VEFNRGSLIGLAGISDLVELSYWSESDIMGA